MKNLLLIASILIIAACGRQTHHSEKYEFVCGNTENAAKGKEGCWSCERVKLFITDKTWMMIKDKKTDGGGYRYEEGDPVVSLGKDTINLFQYEGEDKARLHMEDKTRQCNRI